MAIIERGGRYGVKIWRDGVHRWIGTFGTIDLAREAEGLAMRGLDLPLEDPLDGFRVGRHPVVYFIQAPSIGLVKIGFTTHLATRYSQLNMSSPVDLRVIHLLRPGSVELERETHARFALHRVRGEWFRIAGRLEDFLQRETGALTVRVEAAIVAEAQA